jgi:hypothetical protein
MRFPTKFCISCFFHSRCALLSTINFLPLKQELCFKAVYNSNIIVLDSMSNKKQFNQTFMIYEKLRKSTDLQLPESILILSPICTY